MAETKQVKVLQDQVIAYGLKHEDVAAAFTRETFVFGVNVCEPDSCLRQNAIE